MSLTLIFHHSHNTCTVGSCGHPHRRERGNYETKHGTCGDHGCEPKTESCFFGRLFRRLPPNETDIFGSVFRLPKSTETGKPTPLFSSSFSLSPTPIAPIYLYGKPLYGHMDTPSPQHSSSAARRTAAATVVDTGHSSALRDCEGCPSPVLTAVLTMSRRWRRG